MWSLAVTLLSLGILAAAQDVGDPCHMGSLTLYDAVTNHTLVTPQTCGTVLSASNFLRTPRIEFKAALPNENYTIMLLGTNQTTLPKKYYLHGLFANVKANKTILTIENATVLGAYEPFVALKMGSINYTVLVYRQTPHSPPLWQRIGGFERAGFSPYLWVQRQLPNQVSGPIAGSGFRIVGPSPVPHHPVIINHNHVISINGTTYVPRPPQGPLVINGHHYVPSVPNQQPAQQPSDHVSVTHVHNQKNKNSASKQFIGCFPLILSLVIFSFS